MRLLLLAAVLSSTLSWADEIIEVEASVLGTLAHDYDGKRVRTEMSKLSVLTSRAAGCGKDEVTIMLGPKMRMGEAPAVISTQFALCVPRGESAALIPLPMGTGLVFEADVHVKGRKSNPSITMDAVNLVETVPLGD